MRLYLDTSILGAVLDQEDARRVAASRAVLQSIATRDHLGVISNVVQEELEQAPDHLRQAILKAIAGIEFELALEGEESRSLFSSYEARRSCRRDIETTYGTWR